MSENVRVAGRFRGRLLLVALFAVFFAPIFVALYLNVGPSGWLPFGRSNHGNLVQPAAVFATRGLRAADGGALEADPFQDKWSLVRIEPGPCLAECDRAVYRMRQIHLSMGKDMDRLRRLLLLPRPEAAETAQRVNAYNPGLTILVAAEDWLHKPRPGQGKAEIYLVDPEGMLVLWYPVDAEPGGVIKDLKRLLKISRIG